MSVRRVDVEERTTVRVCQRSVCRTVHQPMDHGHHARRTTRAARTAAHGDSATGSNRLPVWAFVRSRSCSPASPRYPAPAAPDLGCLSSSPSRDNRRAMVHQTDPLAAAPRSGLLASAGARGESGRWLPPSRNGPTLIRPSHPDRSCRISMGPVRCSRSATSSYFKAPSACPAPLIATRSPSRPSHPSWPITSSATLLILNISIPPFPSSLPLVRASI